MMSGWDRTINLTRVSISSTPVLEFGSPEKFLYNLEQTPTVTNMLINPLLPVRECFGLTFVSPRKNCVPRATPTPACSKRKSILRALFIHFIWEKMLPPKPIISGMALITAEVREQSKYRMERWRSLLTCGLHQEPSQASWSTFPAVPHQLACGLPKYSLPYLSLVPADIMSRYFARMTAIGRT